MNALIRFLTNKPLTLLYPSFRDNVSGKMVNMYCDENGVKYLATSKWGWDRERMS